MQTIEGLRRRIKSASDLLSVVKTMKALAAVSIRHYEHAVASLSEYNRTVELGLHIVLTAQNEWKVTEHPDLDGTLGAIVFGTDQGLCGQFNERAVGFAVDRMNDLQHSGVRRHTGRSHVGRRNVVAVGERCTLLLDEAKQPVERTFDVPGGIAGVTPLVQDLLLQIERWRDVERIDQIILVHNRPVGSSLYEQNLVQLLPIDLNWLRSLEAEPWSSRSLPTFTIDREQLFSRLIQQYLFVALYRASAESLASEAASRLAAMQNAERNIKDRLDELYAEYHHQRQNSITAELLDIVAGFEAVESA